jgi:tetratricopeptide (TPR) repeat protein
VEAHKRAAEKARRIQNLLHPTQFDALKIPEGREYLGLLMQLGHICEEAKQFRTAREAWLECMELESNVEEPLTTARDALMRLYVKLGRFKEAYKVGKQFEKDSSVWVRYHTALAACHLDKEDKKQLMADAAKSNIFCAYYLAHYDEVFSKVMEYTEELEDAEHEPQSSLDEAIEYCGNTTDSAIRFWQNNPGALEMLRMVLRSNRLSAEDLDWNDVLEKIEGKFRKTFPEDGVDRRMYASQFRTAMEMLGDAGDLSAAFPRGLNYSS